MDDVLLNKVAIINRCLDRIREEYKGFEDQFATNFTKQDSIILNIQRACQATIDIGNRILALQKASAPQESREIFEELQNRQLISPELSHSMKMMVGFRNIAVHEYQRLDINILKAVIEKHLDDLREYGETVLAAHLNE